jgi:hypothetical protein
MRGLSTEAVEAYAMIASLPLLGREKASPGIPILPESDTSSLSLRLVIIPQ